MPAFRSHINVFYSPDDKCFVADIPDLKFCSAFGKTADQAVREVLIAQKGWLAAAKAHRKGIPKPRYRAAIYLIAS